jgi:uncharacterized phage infection (PIP) family protein YhgE
MKRNKHQLVSIGILFLFLTLFTFNAAAQQGGGDVIMDFLDTQSQNIADNIEWLEVDGIVDLIVFFIIPTISIYAITRAISLKGFSYAEQNFRENSGRTYGDELSSEFDWLSKLLSVTIAIPTVVIWGALFNSATIILGAAIIAMFLYIFFVGTGGLVQPSPWDLFGTDEDSTALGSGEARNQADNETDQTDNETDQSTSDTDEGMDDDDPDETGEGVAEMEETLEDLESLVEDLERLAEEDKTEIETAMQQLKEAIEDDEIEEEEIEQLEQYYRRATIYLNFLAGDVGSGFTEDLDDAIDYFRGEDGYNPLHDAGGVLDNQLSDEFTNKVNSPRDNTLFYGLRDVPVDYKKVIQISTKLHDTIKEEETDVKQAIRELEDAVENAESLFSDLMEARTQLTQIHNETEKAEKFIEEMHSSHESRWESIFEQLEEEEKEEEFIKNQIEVVKKHSKKILDELDEAEDLVERKEEMDKEIIELTEKIVEQEEYKVEAFGDGRLEALEEKFENHSEDLSDLVQALRDAGGYYSTIHDKIGEIYDEKVSEASEEESMAESLKSSITSLANRIRS